jgi:hypothetical protein
MAGESRQTQIVGGVNRIGSDSAIKVFSLTDTVLASTTGWAFLKPQNATMARNISSLMEDFKSTIPAGSGVQAIAALLWTHFHSIYQEHIAHSPATALPAGQIAVNFVVAGYDSDSQVGKLFSFDVPSAAAPTAEVRSTDNPGAWWIGQTDVVARIMNGVDPRASNLPFVQAANQNGNVGTQQLSGLSYAIYFNTMTIQDAIDFAVGLIQITITIQRFTAGIITQQGAVAGVGGPIDVAVVRPGRNIIWIARKELHF